MVTTGMPTSSFSVVHADRTRMSGPPRACLGSLRTGRVTGSPWCPVSRLRGAGPARGRDGPRLAAYLLAGRGRAREVSPIAQAAWTSLPRGGGAARQRGGLGPAADAELAEDVRDVDAHRLLADVQRARDLPVRPPLDQVSEDVPLPFGQRRQAGTLLAAGPATAQCPDLLDQRRRAHRLRRDPGQLRLCGGFLGPPGCPECGREPGAGASRLDGVAEAEPVDRGLPGLYELLRR